MRSQKDRFRKPFIFQTIILVLFVIMFIFFALKTHLSAYPKTFDKTKVEVVSLDDDEKQDVLSLTGRIKSTYGNFVKSITVVKDIDDYCKENPSSYCQGCIEEGCLGFNSGQNIVVEYKKDSQIMEWLLCHEIAHSVVYSDGPGETELHEVVYDLGADNVCFEPEISMSPERQSLVTIIFIWVLGMVVIIYLLIEIWREAPSVLKNNVFKIYKSF